MDMVTQASIHIIPANILETEKGALQAGVRRTAKKGGKQRTY